MSFNDVGVAARDAARGMATLIKEGSMTPLERVTERAMRQGNPELRSVPAPLLTLEEFFDGNDCVGSIGCNLLDDPEPGEFYELLMAIRSKPEVSDIRIQITTMDHPGEEWPSSDRIWIMTTADPTSVKGWFPDRLAPDETWEGWLRGVKYEDCPIISGHKPIAVWYD